MFATDTRILVIDDMPTIRDLVMSQLKDIGFDNIFEAEDGQAALELLDKGVSSGDPFGVVICDWNMPKMTGLQLLKKVRDQERWKELPFILLTSEADRDQVTEAVLAGVSQYIVKPFTPKTFSDKLKTAWKKHSS